MTEPLDVAVIVAGALERLGVRYTIGGSLASSFSGKPRATLDVDIVVELTTEQVDPLVNSLDGFYVDRDAILRAIRSSSNVNLIHHASGIKVDLFIAGSLLEERQLERRVLIPVLPDQTSIYVHSPEDILLQKLHWYRRHAFMTMPGMRGVIAEALRAI